MESFSYLRLALIGCFSFYFLLSYLGYRRGIQNLRTAIFAKKHSLFELNCRHFAGIIVFGLPYVAFPKTRYLLNSFNIPNIYLLISLLLVLSLAFTVSFNYFRKENRLVTSCIESNFSVFFEYFYIRVIFLLAYEFFFRGLLIFELLNQFGPIWAITICTGAYVLIHCFDSKKEILGAMPFGMILCAFSLFTENIWCAFYIHIALSLSYEVPLYQHLTINRIEK